MAKDIQKLARQAFEKLVDEISVGKSEALKSYLRAMGKFHRYSITNAMLIHFARPDATHVAGFRTWLKLGRCVKKDERGIPILAPIILRRKVSQRADAKDLAVSQSEEDDKEVIVRFKTAHVFDISQTQGKDLPKFARISGDPSLYVERMRKYIADNNIKLEYSTSLGQTEGLSCGGLILINSTLPPAQEFSVLVHETAHERMHRDSDNPVKERRIKELEAEAVAFVVCNAIKLECGTSSSDYIQLYSGDKTALLASLERIQSTASEILDAILKQEDKLNTVVSENRSCQAIAA